MLKYSDFSIFKRLSLYFKNKFIRTITQRNKFFSLKNNLNLHDQFQSDSYDEDKLSYFATAFDFTSQDALAQWIACTDQQFGGSSTGQIVFNQKEKYTNIQVKIDTTQKQSMVYYPHVSVQRKFPYYFRVGPFNAIQIQAKTDGKPIQLGISTYSQISGPIRSYGTIVSKSKQWHTYELPFINMKIRGSQQDPKTNAFFFASKHGTKVFTQKTYNMQKIIYTQHLTPSYFPIQDVQIRLLSMRQQNRFIDIKKINLVHRKCLKQFIKDYKLSYFYIVDDCSTKQNEEKQASSYLQCKFLKPLKNGFNPNQIDTGDIKYIKHKTI